MDEKKSRASFLSRGITLNSLKDRQQSLTARLLWAMEWHDTDEQEQIEQELRAVQEDIECMTRNFHFKY